MSRLCHDPALILPMAVTGWRAGQAGSDRDAALAFSAADQNPKKAAHYRFFAMSNVGAQQDIPHRPARAFAAGICLRAPDLGWPGNSAWVCGQRIDLGLKPGDIIAGIAQQSDNLCRRQFTGL